MKRFWNTFAAIFALLPGACFALNDHVAVTLRAKNEVSGVYFTLGDIAAIESSGQRRLLELQNTRIGIAPRIGYTLSVTVDDIRKQLMRSGVNVANGIEWRGADSAVVHASGLTLSEDEVTKGATNMLTAFLEKKYALYRHEISALGSNANIRVPEKNIHITYRLNTDTAARKRMCVYMDVMAGDMHYKTHPIWFSVHLYRNVLVSAMPQVKGALVSDQSVRKQERDVTDSIDALEELPSSKTKLRFKRKMAGGDILTAHSIERMPFVLTGAPVSVSVKAGLVELVTIGAAQGDGNIGDLVKIRNENSNLLYEARVTGSGTATVSLR